MESKGRERQRLEKRVRYLMIFFMFALVVSGLTAVPLVWEVELLQRMIGVGTRMEQIWPAMAEWISQVHDALLEVDRSYRFLFIGTDWLAFGHLVIGLSFIGPLRDPVRNVWVIENGMLACVLVVPVALIFGALRGVPFFWRLADCSFGVFGILPLWLARSYVGRLAAIKGAA